MSFLDDDEERFQDSTSVLTGPPGPPSADQIRARRLAAVGVGIVLLVLILFGIRGCLDARKESALKDYVGSVRELVRESNQIGREFFGTLEDPGDLTPLDFENDIKSSRSGADGVLDRAQNLDVPDGMGRAHQNFILTLELRRDALRRIANTVGTALGREGRDEAVDRIAAQMQAFLASDVIYTQRSVPAMQNALADEGITGERIAASQFLPDIDWLTPRQVGDALGEVRGGGGRQQENTGGLRGLALVQATIAGAALTPGGSVTVQAGGRPELVVQVQNGGESEETDVTVRVTISGGNRDEIEVERNVSRIAAGATADVTIPISPAPQRNEPLRVTVEAEPVPGEEVEDNNRAQYTVTFG